MPRSTTHHPQDPSHSESQSRQQRKGSRIIEAPTTAKDVVLGVAVQIARKYLFIDARRKAVLYLVLVTGLSILTEFFPPADHYYFVQKHNIFNQYGTKLGWFWTCLLVCPFIWLTAIIHHRSRQKAAGDLARMLVATALWYICTTGFVAFEKATGRCHGVDGALRNQCSVGGGKWIPGIDISGHAFILVYSILIMTEEACSFRNWPSTPRSSPEHTPNRVDYDNYKASTRFVQALFLGIFALHLLWDFQLLVTSLYYHTPMHKIMGAIIAVVAWFITYRAWYPVAFPHRPISRKAKSF